MIAANSFTAAHADALLRDTPPEQRTDYNPPRHEEPKGDPLEQTVTLKREMSQVQQKRKDAEKSYGSEPLNLAVAKDYLTKLVANEAVQFWSTEIHPRSSSSSSCSSIHPAWKRRWSSRRATGPLSRMRPRRRRRTRHGGVAAE